MNYRRSMAATALALLASGCDKADTGPRSMEEAKQEAAKLDRPSPGQYKQTVTITKFEVAGAPPEVAAQIKAGMQDSQETSFCLTGKMAEEGFRDMFNKFGEGDQCRYDRFDVSGGNLDAAITCASKAEGKSVVLLKGKVTPQGSDVTMSVDQDNPNSPMGKAKIEMHLVSQRTGDCAAGG